MRSDNAVEATPSLASYCQDTYPQLVGLLSLYCGDREVAEELAQEALVRLWSHWDRVSTLGSPSAWVQRVALNLANSWHRRRVIRRRVEAQLAGIQRVAQDAPDSASAVAVRAAVSQLPERQRMALVLRYYADLSVGEVAQRMQCPEGTVKTLTYQAIQALRRAGLAVSDD